MFCDVTELYMYDLSKCPVFLMQLKDITHFNKKNVAINYLNAHQYTCMCVLSGE